MGRPDKELDAGRRGPPQSGTQAADRGGRGRNKNDELNATTTLTLTYPSFGEFFFGTIDNVFAYNVALSATQFENIRMNGFSTRAPEPSTLSLATDGLTTWIGRRASRRGRQQR